MTILRNAFTSTLIDEVSHEGNNPLRKVRLYEKNDFKTPLDFIDYVMVPPNTTIGIHTHDNNEEIYFILEGTGEMLIGNDKVNIKEGDVIVNPAYGTHGLINNSDDHIKIFIFQVNAD
ncbi:cupin domain-containing protein [Bacillus cereus ATCC 10876]|uniref:cupin domain-containing protein n=1 Tax=Bacillus TaxID=1386 RepID=UPI00030D82B6|nr:MULTISPECIES: cupin domain-containing protein [Bacillus]MBJ3789195.1 cupin domain-containing protein [Bacillus sp. OA1]MDJ0281868.1 cupin domain-containing protein [Bacillus bombysepticus]KFL63937.1 cupin domain protein [Bacillus cereus ATCC 10876]MBO1129456.1 cupin domain-containing protein [Bacillus cereus]MDJ0295857.1 cupin domain-containing protein [Bacillus bombysepticus]